MNNSFDFDAFLSYLKDIRITENEYNRATLTEKTELRNNFDAWKDRKRAPPPPHDIQTIVDLSVSKAIKLIASKRPDTRTNAQFYQDLKSQNKIDSPGDRFPFPSSSEAWRDAWYALEEPISQ